MARFCFGRRIPALLVAGIAATFAWQGPARASVLESSATLPLLNFPYTILGGTCFSGVGLCVSGGSYMLTTVTFSAQSSDETFVTDATGTIDVTNAVTHALVATVSLAGTITQVVIGRLNPGDIGSWTVDLTDLDLTGTLLGHPVTMVLNPADLADDVGTTSIAQSGAFFSVNSFFDVFAEVTFEGNTAFPSGTATATATAPEPATLALLAGPLLAMAGLRRRRL